MRMQTFTGKEFSIEDMTVDDIDIEDIAHSLSLQCRFRGHAKHFYSVAQHSLRVCDLAPAAVKLEALLHDAAEAYVGDQIRPDKVVIPELVEREKKVFALIVEKYSLDTSPLATGMVKACDDYLLNVESVELQHTPLIPSHLVMFDVECPPPDTAKEHFISTFKNLMAERSKC